MQESEVHVARQPIFDNKLNVVGYELLFRSNFINSYNSADGDHATHDVVANSLLLFGLETLTSGKKAFINFTANSLLNNIPAMLPRKLVAVEILEDVIPDAAVIKACKQLKQDGYVLVLDDFAFAPAYLPLVEIADIIKVDFRTTPPAERQQLIRRLQGYRLKFLAEKVETRAEFEAALQMGYSYFQGYFFCKPLVMSGKNLPGYKVNYLHILQEINRPELEFSQIEAIIRRDVSLSYKLLKFINSSLFGFRKRISSLRQALTLLGQKELIKWVSLLALKGIGDDKPGELILRSLIRARFAESLAAGRMPAALVAHAFLMGMFSHIDALLDRPLEEILAEIPLDAAIRDAILEKGHSRFSPLYRLIRAYEQGDWQAYADCVAELGINEQDVAKSYRESLLWAHDQVVANY